MSVLQRSDLEASPLADLHALASTLNIDGFRRLRRDELIDAILARQGTQDAGQGQDRLEEQDDGGPAGGPAADEAPSASQRRRGRFRLRRGDHDEEDHEDEASEEPAASDADSAAAKPEPETLTEAAELAAGGEDEDEREAEAAGPRTGRRGGRASGRETPRTVDGVVDLQPNGSAFVRVVSGEESDDDVYVSAAQVRRCELVPGDRVSGPVRAARRSERYASLVRVETINGEPADQVAAGTRFEELAATFPNQQLALGADDDTLAAIDRLAPIGRGSRVVIAGPSRSGKTELLRRIAGVLTDRDGLSLEVVLVGVRPEEVSEWPQSALAATPLSFAASADEQARVVEQAVERGRRIAARGGDAVVLIDTLDGLHPPAARRALAAARNLAEHGSLTIVGTAARPFGGETTVVALDLARASTGRLPALDPLASGTVRPDALVGDEGAAAIVKARAEALGG